MSSSQNNKKLKNENLFTDIQQNRSKQQQQQENFNDQIYTQFVSQTHTSGELPVDGKQQNQENQAFGQKASELRTDKVSRGTNDNKGITQSSKGQDQKAPQDKNLNRARQGTALNGKSHRSFKDNKGSLSHHSTYHDEDEDIYKGGSARQGRYQGVSGSYSKHSSDSKYGIGKQKPSQHEPFNRLRFMHTNFRFIVSDSIDVAKFQSQADLLFDWDDIVQVEIMEENEVICPITQDSPPELPQIAPCGHVFSYEGIMFYFQYVVGSQKEKMISQLKVISNTKTQEQLDEIPQIKFIMEKPIKCPICSFKFMAHELRNVRIHHVHKYMQGQEIDLCLIQRPHQQVSVNILAESLEFLQQNSDLIKTNDVSVVSQVVKEYKVKPQRNGQGLLTWPWKIQFQKFSVIADPLPVWLELADSLNKKLDEELLQYQNSSHEDIYKSIQNLLEALNNLRWRVDIWAQKYLKLKNPKELEGDILFYYKRAHAQCKKDEAQRHDFENDVRQGTVQSLKQLISEVSQDNRAKLQILLDIDSQQRLQVEKTTSLQQSAATHQSLYPSANPSTLRAIQQHAQGLKNQASAEKYNKSFPSLSSSPKVQAPILSWKNAVSQTPHQNAAINPNHQLSDRHQNTQLKDNESLQRQQGFDIANNLESDTSRRLSKKGWAEKQGLIKKQHMIEDTSTQGTSNLLETFSKQQLPSALSNNVIVEETDQEVKFQMGSDMDVMNKSQQNIQSNHRNYKDDNLHGTTLNALGPQSQLDVDIGRLQDNVKEEQIQRNSSNSCKGLDKTSIQLKINEPSNRDMVKNKEDSKIEDKMIQVKKIEGSLEDGANDRTVKDIDLKDQDHKDQNLESGIINQITEGEMSVKDNGQRMKEDLQLEDEFNSIQQDDHSLKKMDIQVKGNSQQSKEQQTLLGSSPLSNDSLRSGLEIQQVALERFFHDEFKNSWYYYQSKDGQLIFLNPLNLRMLKDQFTDFLSMPVEIKGRIIDLESYKQDSETRKKVKMLQHLANGTQFSLCELDVKSYVSQNICESYKSQIVARQRYRDIQKRKEDKEEEKRKKAQKKIDDFGRSIDYTLVDNDRQFDRSNWQSDFPQLLGTSPNSNTINVPHQDNASIVNDNQRAIQYSQSNEDAMEDDQTTKVSHIDESSLLQNHNSINNNSIDSSSNNKRDNNNSSNSINNISTQQAGHQGVQSVWNQSPYAPKVKQAGQIQNQNQAKKPQKEKQKRGKKQIVDIGI